MRKTIVFLMMVVSGYSFSQENTLRKDEQYIVNHAGLAVQEMELYKIPASITLAQGILETGNGQSDLAQNGNNHFGIKCKDEWTGDRMFHDDDLKGECFRKYSSVQDSYRDHSLFLAERPYYKALFKLNPKDYKAWAHGLKKAGYATNSKYAYILIKLIEKYNLNQFDNITLQEVPQKLAVLYPNIDMSDGILLVKNLLPNKVVEPIQISNKSDIRIKHHPNGNLKYIELEEGETLENIAREYNITLSRLLIYNDITSKIQLKTNQKIFLQPKKQSGIQSEYIVKEGDTMYEIAQDNGIFLSELYKSNSMLPGDEPNVGERILL